MLCFSDWLYYVYSILLVQRQFVLRWLLLPPEDWFLVYHIAFGSSLTCGHLYCLLEIKIKSIRNRLILCAEQKKIRRAGQAKAAYFETIDTQFYINHFGVRVVLSKPVINYMLHFSWLNTFCCRHKAVFFD